MPDKAANKAIAEEQLKAAAFFENAITECGYGKFHYIMILLAIPGTAAIIFSATTMSYIMPSAECDLKLSLSDKGLLNGATYAGMITSALPWSVFSDVMGRRQVLVAAHLGDAFFVWCSSFSQSTYQLLVFRFFGGFCICGGYSAFMTYIAEVHSTKYRSRVIFLIGILLSCSALVLPVIATLIIPLRFHFQIGDFDVHSWQVFIMVASIPSTIVGFSFLFLPESPKFDMAADKNERALRTLQKVFEINTKTPKEDYPVKEIPTFSLGVRAADETEPNFFVKGYRQLRPLFSKEYFFSAMCVFLVDFCVLMCQNTLRLWMPQLFASIELFEKDNPGVMASICKILEHNVKAEKQVVAEGPEPCFRSLSAKAYFDNVIINAISILGYITAIYVVNRYGVKIVLSVSLGCSSIAGFCILLAYNETLIVIISALYLAVENISSTAVVIASVSLFPTSMRNTVVAVALMCGRIGSVLGNIYFPNLIKMGCMPPILWLGIMGAIACAISLLIPNPSKAVFK